MKVLAGSVNQELVAALNRAGASGRGAERRRRQPGEAEQMDPALGAVGRVTAKPRGIVEYSDSKRLFAGGGLCGRRRAGRNLQRQRRPDGGGLRGGVRARTG